MADLNHLLTTIRNAKNTYPELRLGQLLLVAITAQHDLFYVTDEDLIKMIEDFLNKGGS